MLDDPSAAVRALPTLRAYDRADVEAFVAVAEAHERALRDRLDHARQRRSAARAGTSAHAEVAPELTARLQAARAELAQGQAEHDAAVAALSDAAARAAREVLVEAEREAVALRASLADLLDQLAAQSPAPATRARSLRPDASVWTR